MARRRHRPVAFALFLAGGLLLWANGHYKDADGYLSTGSQRFESQRLRDHDARTSRSARRARLPAEGRPLRHDPPETMAKGGKPLFVGVARTRDVDAYLRGVAHSEVSDIDYAPFSARYDAASADAPPARPAGQQRIWAAQGEHALTWDVRSGDWSVVVMNADGSRGVAAAVSAGAKVPYIAEIGYVTLGFGLLFVVATAALTIYGTRPRRAQARARLAGQRADDLLPPGPLARARGVRQPPAREGLQLARRADRQQRAGDAEAAVLEHDQRARLVAARAQLLDHVVAGRASSGAADRRRRAARAGSR